MRTFAIFHSRVNNPVPVPCQRITKSEALGEGCKASENLSAKEDCLSVCCTRLSPRERAQRANDMWKLDGSFRRSYRPFLRLKIDIVHKLISLYGRYSR